MCVYKILTNHSPVWKAFIKTWVFDPNKYRLDKHFLFLTHYNEQRKVILMVSESLSYVEYSVSVERSPIRFAISKYLRRGMHSIVLY